MRAISLGLIAVLFLTSPALAQQKDGFVPLFNSRDLTGWVYGMRQNKPHMVGKGYQVKDGVLYCTPTDGGNLYTEKEYSDFIFRFEFKLTENANNGLGIRAPLEGDAAYVGIELQILDDEGSQYRKLRPEQYHGSIYDVVAAKRGALKPLGQWNQQEVLVRGGRIKVTLNGQVIVDADVRRITDEKVLKKHPGLQRTRGHIGFLGHGAHVEFRNMAIRELK